MRGRNTIYHSLIDHDSKRTRKRKSNSLILRNELILHRYYYYVILKKRQYRDTLEQLEREHFLSPETIAGIIIRQHADLKQIRNQRPEVRELRDRWGWLVW